MRRETGGTRASVGSVMKLLALASAGGRRRLDEQASQVGILRVHQTPIASPCEAQVFLAMLVAHATPQSKP